MIIAAPASFKAPEESSHWYTRAGAAAYQVRSKSGHMRGTTLTDAKKLALVPSVTTVTSIVAKPALTTWLIDQAIHAALTLPRGELSEADYIAAIKVDGKAQGKAAAEEGDRIHNACEAAIKGERYPAVYREHVRGAMEELYRLFPGVGDWRAEDSFASELGYGGKVDLHSPSTGIVVDFKTKDGDFSDGKRLAYDQDVQLAAYQRGLRLPRNKCANIFVSRTHPGKAASHVWTAEQIDRAWGEFLCILALWKAQKKFDPSFTQGVSGAE
ncbi:MAG TPA: hypothetical protein VEY92_08645 [Pseudoxanthomonas sp.]|nr:hypothetical protein [Pseudoxanthomonas sp.]